MNQRSARDSWGNCDFVYLVTVCSRDCWGQTQVPHLGIMDVIYCCSGHHWSEVFALVLCCVELLLSAETSRLLRLSEAPQEIRVWVWQELEEDVSTAPSQSFRVPAWNISAILHHDIISSVPPMLCEIWLRNETGQMSKVSTWTKALGFLFWAEEIVMVTAVFILLVSFHYS